MQKFAYQLPLGQLQLLELVVYLPDDISSENIESVRKTTIKTVLAWHNDYLSRKDNLEPTTEVLVFDIQFKNEVNNSNNLDYKNIYDRLGKCLKHDFTSSDFIDSLSVDINENGQPLQIFGWHDWQLILKALHTPCELWRFLQYHLEQMQYSASSHVSSLKSEEVIISDFLNSHTVFA